MLHSPAVIQNFCSQLRGPVFVVGSLVLSASFLPGVERPHPALVDPAETKCMVCHKDVMATHSVSASGQDCLTCHNFVKKAKKTYLIEEYSPMAPATENSPPVVAAASGGTDRSQDAPPDSPEGGTAASHPLPVATAAEEAPVQPTPSVPVAPSPEPAERHETANTGNDLDEVSRQHAEGLAAFNNAEFDRAFHLWSAMLADEVDHWILQVEVDTHISTAQSTVARYGDQKLYVVKKDDLYWVFSGLFATRTEAIEALKLFPGSLRQGGAFPIKVRQLMPLQ